MAESVKENKVIEVIQLQKYFPVKKNAFSGEVQYLKAVDGVNFHVDKGETLGLAGESGCGKTTTAKVLLNLYTPTQGQIICNNQEVQFLHGRKLKEFRRQVQMVFQDPYESLNPRQKVKDILEEPLIIHDLGSRKERQKRVSRMVEEVGLYPVESFLERFPHELSGGQRQRVAIARALILEPTFLVADEPVSMLDVSIRAGVLNLLQRMIADKNLAGLCISHDLSLLRYLCKRTAIMYLGRIMEIGDTEEIIQKKYHPYTEALLDAVPHPDPDQKYRLDRISGEAPSAANLPPGCRFSNRCSKKIPRCTELEPIPVEIEKGHWVECHLYCS